MPPAAYALVGLFILISIAAGIAAARVIGPWRWWTFPLPAAAAFGALYLIGHRYVVTFGPTVQVFGWEIALPFEVAVAAITALTVALGQRALVGLLQAQQRDPGRDGLA